LHVPVLEKEVMEFLKVDKGSYFLDGTLGMGGHTKAILSTNKNAFVYAIDRDRESIEKASKNLNKFKNRIKLINDNFKNIINQSLPFEKIDGYLFDLGVSSFQLDNPDLGFSYSKDSPLDMRMDRTQTLTAEKVVNEYPYAELVRVFKEFGEFRRPEKLVKEILITRKRKRIKTSKELKEVVRNLYKRRKTMDPLARVFQAIRIEVNKELEGLDKFLYTLSQKMKRGARIVVISFHSLEDRIVKRSFKKSAEDGYLKILTKKPVIPTEEEKKNNPRSRSAKLRAGEKI